MKKSAGKEDRAIKVRIHPTDEQITLIRKTFGCCRWYWNHALADEQNFYYATDEHFITTPAKYKPKAAFLKEVDSLALANEQLALQKSFKSFFNKESRYPNFKSKKRSRKSYTTNFQNGSDAVDRKSIRLPKLGCVNANIYRKPMKGWTLKSATICESPSGKFYCSLLYEYLKAETEPVYPTIERALGFDYSSPLFYVDSNGCSPDEQRHFRKTEERLAKLQMRLSRMQAGSANYKQQKAKIAELHEHIANQRKDFAHKESRRIANSWDVVCVEDINLRAMAQSLRLGKSTNDNGFGMFRNFLEYKLKEQGKHFVTIDKWFPSSKLCGICGYINSDLTLSQREWVCPSCGTYHSRDKDAASNIRNEGFRVLQERLMAS